MLNKKTKRLIKIISIFLVLLGISTFIAPQKTDAATNVAKVTIWSSNSKSGASGINVSGHSWLEVKNISKKNISVGKYTLKPNQSVTVGTWGNKKNGKGIYYNLEAYFHSSNLYPERFSYSKNITAKQMNTLDSKITTNNTWSLHRNCSSFVKITWNSIASSKDKITGNSYPFVITNAIKKMKGYKKNGAMTKKKKTDVKYYDKKAKKLKNATL